MPSGNDSKLNNDLPVRWLNKTQLARYISLAEATINQYVSKRRIPFAKVPGSNQVRFDIQAIDRWIQQGRVLTVEEEMDLKKKVITDGQAT